MTIGFPHELAWLGYIIGMEWPEGDEDAMRRIADAWENAAGQLDGVGPDMDASARMVMDSLEGATSEALQQVFNDLVYGDLSVEKLAEAARAAGEMSDASATNIEYTKIAFYSTLVLTAAQIAWAIAAAFGTFGGSLSSIPVFQAIARTAVSIGLKELLSAIASTVSKQALVAMAKRAAMGALVNTALAAGQDAGIQAYQLATGGRKTFDGGQFLETAGTSVIAGAAGGAAGGAASHALGKVMRPAMTDIGMAANRWADSIVSGVADGTTNGLVGATTSAITGNGFTWQAVTAGAVGGAFNPPGRGGSNVGTHDGSAPPSGVDALGRPAGDASASGDGAGHGTGDGGSSGARDGATDSTGSPESAPPGSERGATTSGDDSGSAAGGSNNSGRSGGDSESSGATASSSGRDGSDHGTQAAQSESAAPTATNNEASTPGPDSGETAQPSTTNDAGGPPPNAENASPAETVRTDSSDSPPPDTASPTHDAPPSAPPAEHAPHAQGDDTGPGNSAPTEHATPESSRPPDNSTVPDSARSPDHADTQNVSRTTEPSATAGDRAADSTASTSPTSTRSFDSTTPLSDSPRAAGGDNVQPSVGPTHHSPGTAAPADRAAPTGGADRSTATPDRTAPTAEGNRAAPVNSSPDAGRSTDSSRPADTPRSAQAGPRTPTLPTDGARAGVDRTSSPRVDADGVPTARESAEPALGDGVTGDLTVAAAAASIVTADAASRSSVADPAARPRSDRFGSHLDGPNARGRTSDGSDPAGPGGPPDRPNGPGRPDGIGPDDHGPHRSDERSLSGSRDHPATDAERARAAEALAQRDLTPDRVGELMPPDRAGDHVAAARELADANARWWNDLSPMERDALIRTHPHEIGNADGIAARDKDLANRISVDRSMAELAAENPKRGISRFIDQLLNGLDTPSAQLRHLEKIDSAVRAAELELASRAARTDSMAPPLHLLGLDPRAFDGQGRIIAAVGDIDSATSVSWHVPGLTTMIRSLGTNLDNAGNHYFRTTAELGGEGSAASIAWIGYDAPSGRGSAAVANTALAEAGGHLLARDVAAFNAGRAVGDIGPADNHIFGHSYGSVASSYAGAEGRLASDVQTITLLGSPGAGPVTHASQFGIGDNVYAASSGRDFVTWLGASDTTQVGRVFNTGLGIDPSIEPFGAQRIAAQSRFSFPLDNLMSHTGYYELGSESLRNFGRIAAGEDPVAAPHRGGTDGPDSGPRTGPREPEKFRRPIDTLDGHAPRSRDADSQIGSRPPGHDESVTRTAGSDDRSRFDDGARDQTSPDRDPAKYAGDRRLADDRNSDHSAGDRDTSAGARHDRDGESPGDRFGEAPTDRSADDGRARSEENGTPDHSADRADDSGIGDRTDANRPGDGPTSFRDIDPTAQNIADWLPLINSRWGEPGFLNNCVQSVHAFFETLRGNPTHAEPHPDPTSPGSRLSDLEDAAGGRSEAATFDQIGAHLLDRGDGAMAVIGTSYLDGAGKPSGGHAYVARNMDGTIRVIDMQSGRITGWPPEFSRRHHDVNDVIYVNRDLSAERPLTRDNDVSPAADRSAEDRGNTRRDDDAHGDDRRFGESEDSAPVRREDRPFDSEFPQTRLSENTDRIADQASQSEPNPGVADRVRDVQASGRFAGDASYSQHDRGIEVPIRAEAFSHANHEPVVMSQREFKAYIRNSGVSLNGDSPLFASNTWYQVEGAGSFYTRDDGTIAGIAMVPQQNFTNPLVSHRWNNVSVVTDRGFYHRDSNGALVAYDGSAEVTGESERYRRDHLQRKSKEVELTSEVLAQINAELPPGTPDLRRIDFNAGHSSRNEWGAPSEIFFYSMEFHDTNQSWSEEHDRNGMGYLVEDLFTGMADEHDRPGIWRREEVFGDPPGAYPESYIVEMSFDGGQTVHRFEFANRRGR
ncbi:alpha/beta hydrolase [Gordonia soli]|uniref:Tox-PL domain-containing protein n=1 Tax=Gordonia soli NBRC 108243 TaxID=1223545 RepID=M0QL84_9ACTN|nr:alpha/beta hydrolase [Gordonia soli]GAC69323.1 hypothetical protein GS4_23_01200 [Gordonia soli NBRC 108243]